jgi:ribose 5-phosphate isomerase B
MRVHLGANSEGYVVAVDLRDALTAAGHEVVWHAAPAFDEGDDYPGIAVRALRAVIDDEDAGRDARAIIVGATGAGEVVAGNKVNGARVVSATDVGFVEAARVHADVNGLVVPVDHVAPELVLRLVCAFLETGFSSDLDDARRLVNVAEFETSGTIEGWTIEP